MNLPMYQAHRLTRERLAPRNGVYFTLHLDEGLNPFDFNPLVREAYLQTAENTVRLAAESGVPCVNLHMPEGVHFKLPGRKVYLFDEYREEYRASLLTFRERMARAADGRVTVLVENTCFTRLRGLPEALDTLLESPAFALTYDAGARRVRRLRRGGILPRARGAREARASASGERNHLPSAAGRGQGGRK